VGRISLAAALAAILHALLFIMDDGWLKKTMIRASVREPIAVTLTYFNPRKKLSSPEKRPETRQYKPIPQEKVSESPLQKQEPVKKVKKNVRVRKSAVSRKSERLLRKTNNGPSTPKEAIKPENTPIQPVGQKTKTSALEANTVLHEDGQAHDLTQAAAVSPKTTRSIPESAPAEMLHLPVKSAIPNYKENPSPKYPRIARRKGYQGTVLIDVLVDRKGRVKDLHLLESSGYESLDQAAICSVRAWVFEPGRRGDEKIDMWVEVPVRFQLK
jgi:protein TonB